MEIKFTSINEDNIMSFIDGLEFGSKVVKYETDEAFIKMENAIIAYNEISFDGIYQKQLIQDVWNKELERDETIVVEDYFRVFCTNKMNIGKGILKESDLDIFNINEGLIFNINPRLYKLARKIASKNELSFKIDHYESKYKKSIFQELKDVFKYGGENMSISMSAISYHTAVSYSRLLSNELKKSIEYVILEGFYIFRISDKSSIKISPFAKIQSSLLNNDKIVRFTENEVKIATLRQYCSNISSKFNIEISCTANKGNFTVYIGKPTEEEVLKEELRQCLQEMKGFGISYDFINELSKEIYEIENEIIYDDDDDFDLSPEEYERIRLRDEQFQKELDDENEFD